MGKSKGMPEGDTVHKLVQMLGRGLLGKHLTRLQTRQTLFRNLRLESLEARGKHALLDLSNGMTVRVHLGMHGNWRRYQPPIRKALAWPLEIEVEGVAYVCHQPKEVEIFPSQDKPRHPILAALGPDLLGTEPDWERLAHNLDHRGPSHASLAELLLDQRIACGLGNVYKSELCFLGPWESGPAWTGGKGCNPFQLPRDLSKSDLLSLYRRGRELLLGNLGGWPRTTTFDATRTPGARTPRCWVYDRAQLPCLRCHRPIQVRLHGLQGRSTFWCPQCQG